MWMNKKTTREILERELDVRGRVPLYNPEALEMIRKQFDASILQRFAERTANGLKLPELFWVQISPEKWSTHHCPMQILTMRQILGIREKLLSPGVSIQTCTEGGNSRCANSLDSVLLRIRICG